MEKRKLTKADIDKVRHIEGFPIAKDEDIIALSDPPYYTACPNPFIEEFIRENGKPYDEATDDYHREPFATDVSEGKNDPIYNAHSYHTKVPYKAIMRYILHYTQPGDIVFDGFCGTGMTGVAAQMCQKPDEDFKKTINQEMPRAKWGARKAILNDLSPAATNIAQNYNISIDVDTFEKEAHNILFECEKENGWMYETQHLVNGKVQKDITGKPIMGRVNYTVWSDVFICPTCSEEMIFWKVALNKSAGKILDLFPCSRCGSKVKKVNCKRAQESYFDKRMNTVVTIAKQAPVLINYTYNKRRYEKEPDEHDRFIYTKIDNFDIRDWYPIEKLPNGFNTEQPKKSHGITYIHQFYTRRNLAIIAAFWSRALVSDTKRLLSWCTSAMTRTTMMYKYMPVLNKGKLTDRRTGTVSGTLYIPSLKDENSVFDLMDSKIKSFKFTLSGKSITTTQSSVDLRNIGANTIDYIFTDPPFGANINYSELSFLWEAWLKVFTNPKSEAIMNVVQGKSLLDYQVLMTRCFSEFYRILKPGRWMTVEFHNSQNAVWNSIQEALLRSGFIVADVRTLDKQQGSFKQVTTTTAVKQDLVISAYKPKERFRKEFIQQSGGEETAWSFVHQHLENLPVVVTNGTKMEAIAERQAYLLFDRMVAYHVMNGIPVPLDAVDFYKGLDEKFLNRDGMYFLPDQVNEYDTIRIKTDVAPVQMELVVSNERSAIAWLYQQLTKPQTYQEMQPKFMQESRTIDRYETIPELSILLEENFLQDSKSKWYIPDRTKEADIIKLRERKLLSEFEGYLATKGNLRLFRIEAIRAGFAKLWADKNYKLIVETAERLPESVVQEDDKLLMYYDLSLGRV